MNTSGEGYIPTHSHGTWCVARYLSIQKRTALATELVAQASPWRYGRCKCLYDCSWDSINQMRDRRQPLERELDWVFTRRLFRIFFTLLLRLFFLLCRNTLFLHMSLFRRLFLLCLLPRDDRLGRLGLFTLRNTELPDKIKKEKNTPLLACAASRSSAQPVHSQTKTQHQCPLALPLPSTNPALQLFQLLLDPAQPQLVPLVRIILRLDQIH